MDLHIPAVHIHLGTSIVSQIAFALIVATLVYATYVFLRNNLGHFFPSGILLAEMRHVGQPRNTEKIQGTVVIVGNNLSGLMAARVCSDHFQEVVIVDRNQATYISRCNSYRARTNDGFLHGEPARRFLKTMWRQLEFLTMIYPCIQFPRRLIFKSTGSVLLIGMSGSNLRVECRLSILLHDPPAKEFRFPAYPAHRHNLSMVTYLPSTLFRVPLQANGKTQGHLTKIHRQPINTPPKRPWKLPSGTRSSKPARTYPST